MPISAVARTLGELQTEEPTAIEEAYEVTALREERVKHFYVGEGNYTAISYGEAVHRQDATGTWQEIDNTLTLQGGRYRTPDGRVRLTAGGEGEVLEINENGYRIGLSFAEDSPESPAAYTLQSVNAGTVAVQNATRQAIAEGDSTAVQYEKLSQV